MAEDQSNSSLLQFMEGEGLVPSFEDEKKWRNVVLELGDIITRWVKKIAWQRGLPAEDITAASATIMTYGSYGLGVHDKESDIDAVCVGPYFATMAEDFFIVLYNMLKRRRDISEIHRVKDAKVPLVQFSFDGVLVDLSFAQLKVLSVPRTADTLDFSYLRDVDETSLKSLSGVRSNNSILKLVPNLENFRLLLRCIKLWAKRRGIYGNLFGFLGGVHLAILSAYVCQRNLEAVLTVLISEFFKTFALWQWPNPVVLEDAMSSMIEDDAKVHNFMPIRLPCSPYQLCQSNITKSTFDKIRAEFLQGHAAMKELLKPKFRWNNIFQHFPYRKKYTRFLKIYLSATSEDTLGDWVGWVKSRFRFLILKLEQLQGRCDPGPSEYTDADSDVPNLVFYWGLQPGRNNPLDMQSLEDEFLTNFKGCQGPVGSLKLFLVQASEMPRDVDLPARSKKGTKACWKVYGENESRVPMFSQHHPQYMVGYVADTGDVQYLSVMSYDGATGAVSNGVELKESENILKPLRMEELRYIWQHVQRKWIREVKEIESYGDIFAGFFSNEECPASPLKKRKKMNEGHDADLANPAKRARVVWTRDLDDKFVHAVNKIALKMATPKRIQELMNVSWL